MRIARTVIRVMTREVARDAAWAYAHVVALVMSCVNKAITRTHNDMKGETSMCVRGEPAESPGHLTVKKRFGNIGANCQTQSDMVARSVGEGDPCVEDQSDDDEGKMQIIVRTLEGKMISM